MDEGNVLAMADLQDVREGARRVANNIGRVMIGKERAVELALTALLAGGHLLIEDVPGVGKTVLAKSLARSLDCSFHRVQCTPDLLPADITGSSIYNQGRGEFEFKPGPIFTQLLLIDEINRATPRTQSALLEAMEERQVTTDQGSMTLPQPFMVLATQNPVELEGTFILPEAQLDRFLMQITIGYPTGEEDHLLLTRFARTDPLAELNPVLEAHQLAAMQQLCRTVLVGEAARQYAIDLVHATRRHPAVILGASPRALLNLARAAQALAALRGRAYVLPDDLKYLAGPVLAHRLITGMESTLKEIKPREIIEAIISELPVPVEDEAGGGR